MTAARKHFLAPALGHHPVFTVIEKPYTETPCSPRGEDLEHNSERPISVRALPQLVRVGGFCSS